MTVHELIEGLRTIPNQQMEVVFFSWYDEHYENIDQWWTDEEKVVLAND